MKTHQQGLLLHLTVPKLKKLLSHHRTYLHPEATWQTFPSWDWNLRQARWKATVRVVASNPFPQIWTFHTPKMHFIFLKVNQQCEFSSWLRLGFVITWKMAFHFQTSTLKGEKNQNWEARSSTCLKVACPSSLPWPAVSWGCYHCLIGAATTWFVAYPTPDRLRVSRSAGCHPMGNQCWPPHQHWGSLCDLPEHCASLWNGKASTCNSLVPVLLRDPSSLDSSQESYTKTNEKRWNIWPFVLRP